MHVADKFLKWTFKQMVTHMRQNHPDVKDRLSYCQEMRTGLGIWREWVAREAGFLKDGEPVSTMIVQMTLFISYSDI